MAPRGRIPSRLSMLYDRLYASSAHGDAAGAQSAFLEIAGLARRREASVVPTTPPPRTVSVVRYDEPRSIDFIALERGARSAVKVEDLDAHSADAIDARLRAAGLEVVRSAPYRKRFDVPESEDVDQADLFNLYVSRGGEAREIALAERDRTPDGTRRAGLALGYPPCCVERFIALERSTATYADGLNEVALRAFVGEGVVPWELNPLSTLAPICFTPCRAECPAALEVARRILAALRDADPAVYDETRDALRRPVLFFRFSLFWVLQGARLDATSVRYTDALPNDDHTRAPEALAAWAWDEVGSVLARGDEVRLARGVLEVRGSGELIARWDVPHPPVARLLRFVEGA